MATKQEIVADIRKNYGNMINLREAGEVLGFSDKRAIKNFLEGVPCCQMGKEKKYLAIDVARRIYDRMTI
ncbi:MAG: hypothetical protein EOM54_10300 [Clostridia bacterium]|nr:hypothetical protein [Clostridia bacterium]